MGRPNTAARQVTAAHYSPSTPTARALESCIISPPNRQTILGFHTNSDAGGSDGTLVLSGNTLYGASYDGGTNGTGAVFAVNTNGTFTLLHDFSAAKTNPSPVFLPTATDMAPKLE